MNAPVADLRLAASLEAQAEPLRALLGRLRLHIVQSKAAGDLSLGRLQATLARVERLPGGAAAVIDQAERAFGRVGTGGAPNERLRGLTDDVLQRQRSAARELSRLADEFAAMAEALDRRLAGSEDARSVALRAMHGEVRTLGERLQARLVEVEDHARRAVATFSSRLDLWEAAAEARETRVADDLAERLDRTDVQRSRHIAELLEAMGRLAAEPARPPTPPVEPPKIGPTAQARAPQPAPPSRSAAALLSAGVACLGFVALAVVLEPGPPTARTEQGLAAAPELRGLIIALPRYALEEAPPAAGAAPSGPVATPTAAPGVFAAELRAVEGGKAGAIERLRALAERATPREHMQLARLYETGARGLAPNPAEARRWTARAAEAGDARATHNLALYYLQGRGGPQDDATALKLFRRAALEGVADSQFNLALLYETGAGGDRNLVEAYKWFQVAAMGGDLKARGRALALETRLSARELASGDEAAHRFARGAGMTEEAVLIPGAATVAEAQKKLARLGYYIGPTDGQDNAAYRRAVEAFGRDQAGRPITLGSSSG